jgi:hypothetical protein
MPNIERRYPGVGYIIEKTMLAVDGLAVSTDSLPRRLASAYVFHLMYAIHDMKDRNREGIPSEVVRVLEEIESAMSSIQVRDDRGLEGAIEGQMDENRAHDLIKKIVEMDHMLLGDMYD